MKQYKIEFLKTIEVIDNYGAAKTCYFKAKKQLQKMQTNGTVKMYMRELNEENGTIYDWIILQELIINEYDDNKNDEL